VKPFGKIEESADYRSIKLSEAISHAQATQDAVG
jgi:hypothetical protein